MVYIFSTVWFPPTKGEEVGKKFLEIAKKFPPDKSLGKTVFPGALMRTESGIKSISMFEVKEGKLEAALERVNKVLAAYSEIEGVNSTLVTMASLAEALELVGLKAPE
ncbi:MAG: hypothetical protein ACTSO6_08155 [Promethearchaeota archaeon]